MATLFISHSSKDDAAANSLELWLRANGFSDIFVDHHSIAGGDKWRDELRASAASCRVVICLVTVSWLESDECFGEFVSAAYTMGRRIIPLFLLTPERTLTEVAEKRLTKIRSEDQGIVIDSCVVASGALDLDANEDAASRLNMGLRAAGALARVGLDPEAFTIDRKRRPVPFPGLTSFGDDDADAALFYGRSREIALVLEELRKMRAERDLRPFVILGASGAGKSSLLKAGVIPRLRRERPAWLPLRIFRPGSDPLLNFGEAVARSLADLGKVEACGLIRDRLLHAWTTAERANDLSFTPAGLASLATALEAEGQVLRTAAGSKNATILISVDQAEELARAEGPNGDALADYLRVATSISHIEWLIAFTVRTDSFAELQRHYRFQGLEARSYDLRALPTFRFDSVVEQPAKRYGVDIDHSLVDSLMRDTPNEDALPLLAFTLQRLWRQFADSGVLSQENYEKLGGLKGLIEDAAERALRGLEPEQNTPLAFGILPKVLDDLGASTFVPALAQISDQGSTIRRVTAWSDFNDEQQAMLTRFDHWRLIVRKGEGNGTTVEVAHEALFREWTRLKSWLEPERARLDALRLLQIDAASWRRNGDDSAFLNHRGKRLGQTAALLDINAYKSRLGKVEFDYLAACRVNERLAVRRFRRIQALVGVLLVGILCGIAAWSKGQWLKEQAFWLAYVHAVPSRHDRDLKFGTPPFRECTQCPEMIVVPAGNFTMGSKDDPHEQPLHAVTLALPFAIGKTEVSFEEWDTCVTYGDCSDVGTAGWGRGKQPVINVTWLDAQQYVRWLSRVTGKPYRLLTEAEWEYAARARSQAHFSFGSDDAKLGDYAWFFANSENRAHAGAERKANLFGLYDMYGNVSEWVEDCYSEDYRVPRSNGAAWTSNNCGRRVIRGGSFQDRARMLRSASRTWSTFDKPERFIGFRVARTLR